MRQEEIKSMVWALEDMGTAGIYTVVTWNGVNFEFPLLAQESGLITECEALSMHQVDMPVHAFRAKRRSVKLETAAQGMDLRVREAGLSHLESSRLWVSGERERVIDQVCEDVRLTVALAEACEKRNALRWTSPTGRPLRLELPLGCLCVWEAMDRAR